MEEIVNKVKQSGLIQLDLSDFNPDFEIRGIDLKNFLFEELILKEKEYRLKLNNIDWSVYSGKAIYVYCSVDSVIPSWAYMLICSKLADHGYLVIKGTKDELQKILLMEEIDKMDTSNFIQKKVVLKGCSQLDHAEFALTYLTSKLIPVVSSLMFGEPCSTVPIYKNKK